jgi:hypothetical protein
MGVFVRVNGLIVFDVDFHSFLVHCASAWRNGHVWIVRQERERERDGCMHACMHGVERRDSARGFWDWRQKCTLTQRGREEESVVEVK